MCFQALQFQRSLDDVQQCVGSVERDVSNEDCGSDLPSVSRLLKALQGLEEEVDGLRDRIQVLHLLIYKLSEIDRQNTQFTVVQVKPANRIMTEQIFGNLVKTFYIYQGLVETAKTFYSQGNFLAEEIQTRVTHTINRSNSSKVTE